jgi:hypothetical protein
VKSHVPQKDKIEDLAPSVVSLTLLFNTPFAPSLSKGELRGQKAQKELEFVGAGLKHDLLDLGHREICANRDNSQALQ